jgi:hypothetical protein
MRSKLSLAFYGNAQLVNLKLAGAYQFFCVCLLASCGALHGFVALAAAGSWLSSSIGSRTSIASWPPKRTGYQYFGVEAGTQCFAGNDITRARSNGKSPTCNWRCAGDADEICGGDLSISVFRTEEPQPSPPPPPAPSPPPPSMYKREFAAAGATAAIFLCRSGRMDGQTNGCARTDSRTDTRGLFLPLMPCMAVRPSVRTYP